MPRPRIADLFCGAGGAAMGLHRAGFDVIGFDTEVQKNYPFDFVRQDALTVDLSPFDAVWASPPCQGYSIMNNLPWLRGREYPLLILPVREALEALGKPYIIENVMGARHGAKGLQKRGLEAHGMQAGWLSGGMFKLPFYRHRLLESNWFWMQPGHPKHMAVIKHGPLFGNNGGRLATMVYSANNGKDLARWQDGAREAKDAMTRDRNGAQANGVDVGHAKGWRLAAEAMGIDWMKREELTQAIPPAYSEFLGRDLMRVLSQGALPLENAPQSTHSEGRV